MKGQRIYLTVNQRIVNAVYGFSTSTYLLASLFKALFARSAIYQPPCEDLERSSQIKPTLEVLKFWDPDFRSYCKVSMKIYS